MLFLLYETALFDNCTEKRHNFSVIVKEMSGNMEKKYQINSDVIQNYVDAINSITEPMSSIKKQLVDFSKPMLDLIDNINKPIEPIKNVNKQIAESMKLNYNQLDSINNMSDSIKQLSSIFPNEQTKLWKRIME